MSTLYAVEPEVARKAAAFVLALREVEEKFGYALDLDNVPLNILDLKGGTGALPFELVREMLDDPLALGVKA